MSCYFKPVSKYKDANLLLPRRSTQHSAGYDFVVAEDIVVPSIWSYYKIHWERFEHDIPKSSEEVAKNMKELGTKPTLVSTGMKCYLDPGKYLELSVRSSTPLKNWLILANGVGIIDRDYVDNESNEGEIFFQLINLSPYSIYLHKGDKIGQGIIKEYGTIIDDNVETIRTGGFGSTTE